MGFKWLYRVLTSWNHGYNEITQLISKKSAIFKGNLKPIIWDFRKKNRKIPCYNIEDLRSLSDEKELENIKVKTV